MTAVRREGRAFYVPSRTTDGVTYRVDVGVDGTLFCNCTGFEMRRTCWHVALIREEMEMNETMTTALTPIMPKPITSLLPTERDYALIDKAAALVFNGAVALPKELNTQQKVAAVMLYGLELGLAPMTAIRHLYIVNGRVQPSCEVMAGLLLSRHPDARISLEEINNERCTMRLVWPSRDVNDTYTVTWDDIKRAKLDQGEVAQKYPQDRLRYHCTKRLLRVYAPDVINGLDQGAPAIEAPERYVLNEDDADLYNDGDRPQIVEGQLVDRDTGEVIEPGAQQETPVGASGGAPALNGVATSPAAPPASVAPVDLLNDIKERHGAAAAIAARAIMPIHFGTADLLKLTADQRADYVGFLRVRLDSPDHAHEPGYTAEARYVCIKCGEELPEALEDGAAAEQAQPAMGI